MTNPDPPEGPRGPEPAPDRPATAEEIATTRDGLLRLFQTASQQGMDGWRVTDPNTGDVALVSTTQPDEQAAYVDDASVEVILETVLGRLSDHERVVHQVTASLQARTVADLHLADMTFEQHLEQVDIDGARSITSQEWPSYRLGEGGQTAEVIRAEMEARQLAGTPEQRGDPLLSECQAIDLAVSMLTSLAPDEE